MELRTLLGMMVAMARRAVVEVAMVVLSTIVMMMTMTVAATGMMITMRYR